MTGFVPPVADAGDIIGLIVFLVIALLSVAGQIMNKVQENQKKAGPPPRPGPRPQPQRQPGGRQAPVANEIDQFVRQAAQRRAGGGRQPVGGQPLVEAVPVELLEPAGDDSGSVAEHVRTHVASESVGTLSSRTLESDVAQADENLEERVHDVFDHKLGRLGDTPGETAKESGAAIPPTAAAGLAAMFATPGNIRQAIIMSEILSRPESRWK